MRLVFFGTPELALPSLRAVAERYDVRAVVCQPDKPQGRRRELRPPPVKAWALEHDIPVVQPSELNDGAFEAWLREQAPDVCPLAAYGRILKQGILEVPPHGFINVHPSLLPKYRGASPIQTAILEGETVTGVSIMRLDAGMDTGDIVLQREMAIAPDDTAGTLTEKLAGLGAELLVEALDLIASGKAVLFPQDDSRATTTRPFEKADGRIDWTQPAEHIHNLVRAMNPWPVAHCLLEGEVCRIHKTEVLDEPAEAEPGVVVRVEKDRVVVAAGEGCLAILVFQAPG
ncbi:MAG TPA: methionyl-tRNA formyltransferase, partial [Candidatus Hydrogenedentes bacterium]|nr:methionyl-tRNA formyltransferase [Candidatus Hydrogenedentota bacterium]